MRKFAYWAVIISGLGLTVSGCGGDISTGDGFSIYASPSRSHAPGKVSFELTRNDGQSVETCVGKWKFGDGIELSGAYDAVHEFREPGNYEVEVELDCSGKKDKSSTTVEIYPTVDLAVAALEARPLNISSDGTLLTAVQVSNLASEALQVPTYLDIYLTPSDKPDAWKSVGSLRVYRHTLEKLPASGEKDSVIKLDLEVPMDKSIRTGAYYVAAVINADGKIGEKSLDNNVVYSMQTVMVRNQATDGADFKALGLEVRPSTTSLLSSAAADINITNIGSTTDEPFKYQIWLGAKDNAVDMSGAVLVHESTIDGGMSGVEQAVGNVMISITPAVSEPGLYYFWLVLDSDDQVIERNEENNKIRSTAPVLVSDSEVLDADIMVQSVVFEPESTSRGGSFTTKLSLYNQGAQPTGSFVCAVFLSDDMSLDVDRDKIVGSVNIDDLQPKKARDISAIIETDTGIKTGKYWVYVFCDSSGVVSEANEDNNVQRSESRLEVIGNANVDLVLGQSKLESPAAVNEGDTISLSTRLCNQGMTSAGPSYLSLTRINTCDRSEVEADRVLCDGLAPGECRSFVFKTDISCDFWCSSYQYRLMADVTNIVTETVENNNRSTIPDSVTVSGSECVCKDDHFESNDLWGTSKSVAKIDDDLTVCVKDKDFFMIDLPEGGSYELHLNHNASRAPLKLTKYRGSEVVGTYVGGDDLYLSGVQVHESEKPIHFSVTAVNEKDEGNYYHLNLDTYTASTGIDLAVSDLSVEGELNASEYEKATVKVANLGSTASPDVLLGYYLTASGEIDDKALRIARISFKALAPGASVTAGTSLRLPADLPGGRYHLAVRIDDEGIIDDSRPSNNIARMSAWNFDRSCYDSLDPNDTLETPRRLALSGGSYHHGELTVCQTNPDFYAVDVKHGQTIDISAAALSDGDFDLYLYDVLGNEIAASRTGAKTEKISLDYINGDQTLIIGVRQVVNEYNKPETAYGLDVKVGTAPSWLVCSEASEPNDFFASAADLRSAAVSGETAQICPDGDEDYYAIDMTTGDRLQIGFETESPGLRAVLYAGPEHRFVSMLTNLRVQQFDYTAIEDAAHYIRVFSNDVTLINRDYRMLWLGDAGTDLAVSGLSAKSPAAGSAMTYAFDIINNSADETSFKAVVTLSGAAFDAVEGTIGAKETKHFDRKIILPDNISGRQILLVRIENKDDSALDNNAAQLELDIAAACRNDIYEPDDNILRARMAAPENEGVICPGDEDWYKVENAAKAVLAFTHAEGDLAVASYDAQGNILKSSDSASDTEEITLENAVYIRVRGTDSSVSNAYTLKIE